MEAPDPKFQSEYQKFKLANSDKGYTKSQMRYYYKKHILRPMEKAIQNSQSRLVFNSCNVVDKTPLNHSLLRVDDIVSNISNPTSSQLQNTASFTEKMHETENKLQRRRQKTSIVSELRRRLEEVDETQQKTYLRILTEKITKKAINDEDTVMMRDLIDRIDGKPRQNIGLDGGEDNMPISILSKIKSVASDGEDYSLLPAATETEKKLEYKIDSMLPEDEQQMYSSRTTESVQAEQG